MTARRHKGKKASGSSKGAAAPSPTIEVAPPAKRRPALPRNAAAVSKPPAKELSPKALAPKALAPKALATKALAPVSATSTIALATAAAAPVQEPVQAATPPAPAEHMPAVPAPGPASHAPEPATSTAAIARSAFPEWPFGWSGLWSAAPMSVATNASAEASQAGQQVQESAAATASETTATWLEFQSKIWGLAFAQREAGLSLLGSLMAARSVSDAVEIQTRHAGRAFGAASARWRDLSDTAQRLMGSAVPGIRSDKKGD